MELGAEEVAVLKMTINFKLIGSRMMTVVREMEGLGGSGFAGKRSLLTNAQRQDSAVECPKSSWRRQGA